MCLKTVDPQHIGLAGPFQEFLEFRVDGVFIAHIAYYIFLF